MHSTCHKLHEGAILNLIALHICDTQRLKKKIEKNSIANLRVIEKRPVVLTANKEHQVFEVTTAWTSQSCFLY